MLFKFATSVIPLSASIVFLPFDSESRNVSKVKSHIRKTNVPAHSYKRKTPNKSNFINTVLWETLPPIQARFRNDLYSGGGKQR